MQTFVQTNANWGLPAGVHQLVLCPAAPPEPRSVICSIELVNDLVSCFPKHANLRHNHTCCYVRPSGCNYECAHGVNVFIQCAWVCVCACACMAFVFVNVRVTQGLGFRCALGESTRFREFLRKHVIYKTIPILFPDAPARAFLHICPRTFACVDDCVIECVCLYL